MLIDQYVTDVRRQMTGDAATSAAPPGQAQVPARRHRPAGLNRSAGHRAGPRQDWRRTRLGPWTSGLPP